MVNYLGAPTTKTNSKYGKALFLYLQKIVLDS